MNDKRFAERQGLSPEAAPITVRHEAPRDLRGLLIDFAYDGRLLPQQVRLIVCKVLLTRPNEDNWSAFPNVDEEVRKLLDECDWFEVYDIIEALYSSLASTAANAQLGEPRDRCHDRFAAKINEFFAKKGVGWQLIDGRIEVRGPETFEIAVRHAVSKLEDGGLHTAAQEIHEALRDLARRPTADVTGAIQHAMAATECVAREAANNPNATLGQILCRHPGLVPPPLDEGLKKIWGYASETARHLREGRMPSYEEAELVVTVSAGIVTYLEAKISA